jgi:hypothetical protein
VQEERHALPAAIGRGADVVLRHGGLAQRLDQESRLL